MIDVGISDYQLIYCTRKIKRTKHNMHNQIQVRSLKKYSAEIFTNALKTVQFPNYNIFSNVNVAYSDLLNKISDTIDRVAPRKEISIKNNTQEWFDNEIVEAIKIRENYFKIFKKSNLQIDYNFYIEAKYNTQKLIKQKSEFFNTKLTENTGKPKELWKTLKTLGLASIKSSLTNICLKAKDGITNFDDKKDANILKNFFCTLADDLLANLSPPSLRFDLSSVRQYYQKILKYTKSKFKFNVVSEETVL